MLKDKLIIIGLLFLLINVHGQDKFPNTLFLNDTLESPQASLNDIKWIQGHWKGEAFGGIAEEVWTPALGKSMMCAFKLVINDEVKFYELITITEEDGSLILRLKHFHSDLKGWEEKDDTVDFKLVKITEDMIYFDGFSFQRLNDDEMNIYVVIENREEKSETKFNYQKVQN
jgi:hypothetical protein